MRCSRNPCPLRLSSIQSADRQLDSANREDGCKVVAVNAASPDQLPPDLLVSRRVRLFRQTHRYRPTPGGPYPAPILCVSPSISDSCAAMLPILTRGSSV